LQALENAFREAEPGQQIASVTICRPDGRQIVYFIVPVTLNLLKACEVAAQFG
jgi:hypothetical protein